MVLPQLYADEGDRKNAVFPARTLECKNPVGMASMARVMPARTGCMQSLKMSAPHSTACISSTPSRRDHHLFTVHAYRKVAATRSC